MQSAERSPRQSSHNAVYRTFTNTELQTLRNVVSNLRIGSEAKFARVHRRRPVYSKTAQIDLERKLKSEDKARHFKNKEELRWDADFVTLVQ